MVDIRVNLYYRKLNILKLSDLYHYETEQFMYLVLKNNFPPKLNYFLTTSTQFIPGLLGLLCPKN